MIAVISFCLCVLVLCYCIINYHKCHSQLCRLEVSVDLVSSLLRVSHHQNQDVNRAELLSRSSEKESASKLTQMINRILFLVILGMRSHCWLSARGCPACSSWPPVFLLMWPTSSSTFKFLIFLLSAEESSLLWRASVIRSSPPGALITYAKSLKATPRLALDWITRVGESWGWGNL